jgi:hypothetical protein
MAQQIVTLHEKNGGLSKNGNIISNQDADLCNYITHYESQ